MKAHCCILRVIAVFFLAGLLLLPAAGTLQAAKKKEPEVIESTDPLLRLQGWAEHQKMIEASPFAKLKWSHLGPTNISGRCTDIAVVGPKGKDYTIFVATASGGVWKTVNEGTTWEPIFDREASTSIGDIAVDPRNPDVIWVGTGEANIFRSSQAGVGIYKTTDGGKNWKHMGLADTYTIGRVVIDPGNSDIVYVAASGHEWTNNAERGVFKTTDGGATWEKVLFISDKTGSNDLVMDPTDSSILYAAVWQRMRLKWNDPRNFEDTSESGIYKTTDAGATWTPVNTGLPDGPFRGRIGIDICRSQPRTLYAFVDNYEIAREPTPEELADPYGIPSCGFIKGATVYRSDDGAAGWTLACPVTDKMKPYMERHSNTYGWVFAQIRVDPNDPDTYYTMGLGLNVSTDGGESMTPLRGMHGDHHGLWIDPDNSNYLINVQDGGIVISYDKGKNWKSFLHNLPVCQFFNVSYDMAQPFHVYGSMQDHGSFRGVVDLSRGRTNIPAQEWEGAPGGEGSTHAIDPENPDIVYSAGFYGHITRADLSKPGEGWYRFENKDIYPKILPGEAKLRAQWLAPIVMSPHHKDTIYLGTQYLYRSRFRGDNWERISPDLTYNIKSRIGDIPYQTIFSISESPLKDGLIYAGTDDGRVHVTRDAGKSWKEIVKGLPFRKWVSRIVASQYDIGTVYMTQNGKRDDDFSVYVWKSTDFGNTWTSIAGNIPLGPVNVIREDPVQKNILYLGTDNGAYVSTDGGETWNVIGGDLPSCYVQDLVIHPRDNILVIATHGRGMWAMDATPINKKRERRRRF